jgi:Flp pilus assembly protein TadB
MEEIRLFSTFGKAFIPQKLAPTILSQFEKAGSDKVPYTEFGIMFFVTFILTYFIYIPYLYPIISVMHPLIFWFITFITWSVMPLILSALSILAVYFYIDLKIYNRTKNMEDKLGDYLTMVSTNLKGGMSFENALWTAIRDEFGLLSTEMGIVSKKVMTGSNIVTALNGFSNKYNSPIIKRSLNLIVSEIESGGKISDIIDKVVTDLKKTRLLKQEMAASTLTYIIFISVIVVAISPVLFALSYQLLEVMLGFMSRFAGLDTAGASLPISFGGEASIDPKQFKQFSFFAISIISIFASMIISIIQKGDIRSGIKYIPMFWVSSIIIYVISQNILSGLFAGLLV